MISKATIQPCRRLSVVTITKLRATSCQRRYFWEYVMNLAPRGLSLNFWVGTLGHAGIECRLSGGTPAAVRLAISQADQEYLKDQPAITPEMQAEMEIYRQLLPTLIEGFYQRHGGNIRIKRREVKFDIPLACGVTYCGTIDGLGEARVDTDAPWLPTMFEFKFLSQISSDTFDTMAFNAQVHGYAGSLPQAKRPKQFAYCIVRKPSKWVKRGQSVPEFVAEIEADVAARPEFYFAAFVQSLGVHAVADAQADINAHAHDLHCKYERLRAAGVLHDPGRWPRDDRQCNDYGRCPYLDLCKNQRGYRARLPYYKQRELRYEAEAREMA